MKTRSKSAAAPKGLRNKTNVCNNNSDSCVAAAKRKSSENPLSTPKKPRISQLSPEPQITPSRTPSNIFHQAKAAFRRCATPSRLIGRSKERNAIAGFIQHHVINANSGSLYISGCPGTGKTALLNEVFRDYSAKFKSSKHEIIHVMANCMALADPKAIYTKILHEINPQKSSTKDSSLKLESLFLCKRKAKSPIYIIVLDEIDQLITSDQNVLYQLFEWSANPDSSLVLIGIANALDLTDRFLPRLKSKGCEPILLNFNPYEVGEITEIIKDRLLSLEDQNPQENTDNSKVAPLMLPMAIEMAARKIANSGDLRKALDVCRRAIELVESETKVLSESNSDISLSKICEMNFNSPLKDLGEMPKVTMKHIMSATSAYSCSPNTNKIKNIHTNQKMILCSIMLLQLNSKQNVWELSKVYEGYVKICKFNKYPFVTNLEFNELVSVLESTGLIIYKKQPKLQLFSKMIALNVRADEIQKGCEDNQMLTRVLENGINSLNKK